jgi:hypothetical protein
MQVVLMGRILPFDAKVTFQTIGSHPNDDTRQYNQRDHQTPNAAIGQVVGWLKRDAVATGPDGGNDRGVPGSAVFALPGTHPCLAIDGE